MGGYGCSLDKRKLKGLRDLFVSLRAVNEKMILLFVIVRVILWIACSMSKFDLRNHTELDEKKLYKINLVPLQSADLSSEPISP